jgi:hypothetical protein
VSSAMAGMKYLMSLRHQELMPLFLGQQGFPIRSAPSRATSAICWNLAEKAATKPAFRLRHPSSLALLNNLVHLRDDAADNIAPGGSAIGIVWIRSGAGGPIPAELVTTA